MSNTVVESQFGFHVLNASPDELEQQCGVVMQTLVDLEGSGGGVSDAAVSLNLGERLVQIELNGHGDSFEAAHGNALSAVRSAILAAGGMQQIDDVRYEQVAEKTELIDA